MDNIIFATAGELAEAIRFRQVSSVEVTEAHLAHVRTHNKALGAIVTLNEDAALKRAAAADLALARGEVWGPLHGVPITLEDAHATAGLRSTWGGYPPFSNHIPANDGVVAARMQGAGAILLGKTNGPAIWGKNSIFPETNNPWDLERSPGGSSAGCGAAVAAGLSPLDIGMDTLGSIQSPAHACGIFGMRPTEHLVPVADAFFLDPIRKFRIMSVAGPMARSIEDLRLALQVIAGPDLSDPEVPPTPWEELIPANIGDLRIAWTPVFPGWPIAGAICQAMEDLARELAHGGARVVQVLPEVDLAKQIQLGFHLFNLLAGTFSEQEGRVPTTLEAYLTALAERDGLIASWTRFFAEWDVLISPAGVTTAFRRADGELMVDGVVLTEAEKESVYIPYGLSPVSGCPMIVVPLGRDKQGLPFGVQIMGKRWDDQRQLTIAQLISEITGGFQRPPQY